MQKKYDSTDSSNCSGILFSDIIYNKSSMNFGKKFASTELVLMLYVLSKGRLNITASTTYFLVYTYTYIHKDIFCTYITNHTYTYLVLTYMAGTSVYVSGVLAW